MIFLNKSIRYIDLPEEIKTIIQHVRKFVDNEVDRFYKMDKYSSLLEKSKEESNKYLDIRNIQKPSSNSSGEMNMHKSAFSISLFNDQNCIKLEKGDISLVNSLLRDLVDRIKGELKEKYEIVQTTATTNPSKIGDISITLSPHLSKSIMDYINSKNKPMKESAEDPEWNPDMSGKDAKRTLRTLSADIINKIKKDKHYKITQYTANIYANIISKNLLNQWSKGYSKFIITLDSYQSFFSVEFKVPKLDQGFIGRFVDGKESLDGFLHRSPIIKVKMSPRILHQMKNPDDAYQFFKSLIQYYDRGITKASRRLTVEMMRLPRNIKHLISNTNLYTMISVPMSLLFVFTDVQINQRNPFKLKDSDVRAVNQFVKNITSRYASPEKEKKAIIEDMHKLVKSFQESGMLQEHCFLHFTMEDAVKEYLNHEYDKYIEESENRFIEENMDEEPSPHSVQSMMESFGMKKLKKIPRDIIPYIQIETQAIKTYNDKHLIMGYCVSKLEIVDWYINLLEAGSKRYIVPHTKQYMIALKLELLKCYKSILNKKVNDNDYKHPVPWTDKYDG